MEILALLGLAYVSTVLNTQIMNEHEKQAAPKQEKFTSKYEIINRKDERNWKNEKKKMSKRKDCENNYIQYPVKLDNLVGKFSSLDDYYKLNETGKTTSKFPTAHGFNLEYEQSWGTIKQ